MSFFGNKDFFTEVAFGNIAGNDFHRIQMSSIVDASDTEQTLWDGPTPDYLFLISGQALEVVSTSVADDGSPAGTGAQTVDIETLDASGNILTETVTLNGTTAVALTGSNHQFRRKLQVNAAGSGGVNAGVISLQVSGGGTVIDQIEIGLGASTVGIYTVPINTESMLQAFKSSSSKGDDIDIFVKLIPSVKSTIKSVNFNLYQNVNVDNAVYTEPGVALTSAEFRVISTNIDTPATALARFLERAV